ncbi:hypothetical protein [Rhodopirellula baltica]
MNRIVAISLALLLVPYVCAEEPDREVPSRQLPILKVSTDHLPARTRETWAKVELRGKLVPGDVVAKRFPGSPEARSSSGDVYFIGYTTLLDDTHGRLLSAEIEVAANGHGTGRVHVVRAGNFSKGSREFCIQIWRHTDTLMLFERPAGFSDADVAQTVCNCAISAKLNKLFVK